MSLYAAGMIFGIAIGIVLNEMLRHSVITWYVNKFVAPRRERAKQMDREARIAAGRAREKARVEAARAARAAEKQAARATS